MAYHPTTNHWILMQPRTSWPKGQDFNFFVCQVSFLRFACLRCLVFWKKTPQKNGGEIFMVTYHGRIREKSPYNKCIQVLGELSYISGPKQCFTHWKFNIVPENGGPLESRKFLLEITIFTRWAPASYKWSYNPYKWPYKWLTVLITLVIGVINPVITGRGPTL